MSEHTVDSEHHCEWCGRLAETLGWSGDPAEPDPGRGAWCERCQWITYCQTCEDAVVDTASSVSRQHYIDTGEYLTYGQSRGAAT